MFSRLRRRLVFHRERHFPRFACAVLELMILPLSMFVRSRGVRLRRDPLGRHEAVHGHHLLCAVPGLAATRPLLCSALPLADGDEALE